MVIRIVAVGRLADPSVRALCDQYTRRLGRSLRLEIREVRAPAGRVEPAARMRAEGDRLLDALPAGTRVIALTRAGQAESSLDFAKRLEGWQRDARDVALIIGGAFGLDRRVLDRAETRLCLSAMTLPHELARLVLLEQLYRATTILAGSPYHKGGGS